VMKMFLWVPYSFNHTVDVCVCAFAYAFRLPAFLVWSVSMHMLFVLVLWLQFSAFPTLQRGTHRGFRLATRAATRSGGTKFGLGRVCHCLRLHQVSCILDRQLGGIQDVCSARL
jgi:hypothetical protein